MKIIPKHVVIRFNPPPLSNAPQITYCFAAFEVFLINTKFNLQFKSNSIEFLTVNVCISFTRNDVLAAGFCVWDRLLWDHHSLGVLSLCPGGGPVHGLVPRIWVNVRAESYTGSARNGYVPNKGDRGRCQVLIPELLITLWHLYIKQLFIFDYNRMLS